MSAKTLTPEGLAQWKELFKISAPVALTLVNSAPCFHDNASIQALALIGAGIAISKEIGYVERDEFLTACALMWDSQQADFETVEARVQ